DRTAADRDRRANGNNREASQRGDQRNPRREWIEEAIGHRWPHVFFEEKLQRVGDWLQQPRWADTIWSDAHLQATDRSAFEPCHVRHARQQSEDDDQRADDVNEQLRHAVGAPPCGARRHVTDLRRQWSSGWRSASALRT